MIPAATEAGAQATERLNVLLDIQKRLEQMQKLRDREPDKRWQAHYDLMLAQIVAYQVKAYEYRACLAEMVQTRPRPSKMPSPQLSIEWDLDHSPEPQGPQGGDRQEVRRGRRACSSGSSSSTPRPPGPTSPRTSSTAASASGAASGITARSTTNAPSSCRNSDDVPVAGARASAERASPAHRAGEGKGGLPRASLQVSSPDIETRPLRSSSPAQRPVEDVDHLVDRPADRLVDAGGPLIDRDRLVPGQADLDGAPGVDAPLVGVHVLQVDLDPPDPVDEPIAQGAFHLGSNAAGQLFAVLDMVVGANLEMHGQSSPGYDAIRSMALRAMHVPIARAAEIGGEEGSAARPAMTRGVPPRGDQPRDSTARRSSLYSSARPAS